VCLDLKIGHIAVELNSEEDADRFFEELLGLKKISSKVVSADLIESFFGVNRDQKLLRYGNNDLDFEVFITGNTEKSQDIFTHTCIFIENRDKFVKRVRLLGFKDIKVPRQEGNGYYLFVQDSFENLYEIKESA